MAGIKEVNERWDEGGVGGASEGEMVRGPQQGLRRSAAEEKGEKNLHLLLLQLHN